MHNGGIKHNFRCCLVCGLSTLQQYCLGAALVLLGCCCGAGWALLECSLGATWELLECCLGAAQGAA
eukprot:3321333-Lingulodinium_polyedra.AAC.1